MTSYLHGNKSLTWFIISIICSTLVGPSVITLTLRVPDPGRFFCLSMASSVGTVSGESSLVVCAGPRTISAPVEQIEGRSIESKVTLPIQAWLQQATKVPSIKRQAMGTKPMFKKKWVNPRAWVTMLRKPMYWHMVYASLRNHCNLSVS